ncbi:HAD family hydrolase [Micromonospora sonneratiae]|uniref:HAD family hydrolase n=1 Tax=Micromonospora sonneratiae TaxID=1184706 RepID=A0ABW3Y581_9ACTN
MSYRWIVTDLDGTLVDRSLRMVPRSRAALHRFRQDGGQVVIATGRSRESAAPYYAELELTGPAILLNGAQVCDLSTGEVLLDRRLSTSAWVGVSRLLDDLPEEAAGVAFVGGRAYRVAESVLLDAYAARDGLTIEPVTSWDDLPTGGVSKAMVICASSMVAGGVAGRAALPGVTTLVSEPTYVELLPAGTDKGTALTWLARHCQVPLDEVAAVGDNPNDIPMFAVAGLAAAVYGGHPDACAAATVVVGRCDEGAVADVVSHIGALA